LGSRGERVLAFAQVEMDDKYDENFKFDIDEKNFPIEKLTFIGYISMIDPPRPAVRKAVEDC